MKKIILSVFVLMYVLSAIPANALLVKFAGRNLWWDQDANPSVASGDDADGLMYWSDAMAWADNLVDGDLTDWRLPASDDLCIGYNCTNSEMGDLFYNILGGNAGEDIRDTQDVFINLQTIYWSSTVDEDGNQLFFDFSSGEQLANPPFLPFEAYVWAVHDDPVVVPEPASLLLIGSGLVGLIGLKRKWPSRRGQAHNP